jgi:hypothetical protein
MWYEQHKEDTAATDFVEIVTEEVNLLLSFFGKKKEYDEQRLDALKKRLDAAITASFGDDGCFVKLHTRSPKGLVFFVSFFPSYFCFVFRCGGTN